MLATPWLIRPRPVAHPRIRLICFPFAGAGPSAYRAWRTAFSPDVDVCFVQLPGRESRMREQSFTGMTPLVDALETHLEPFLHGSFVFYGHSLGALVAFELTRRLRQSGRTLPMHLFVAARRAPHLPAPSAPLHQLDDDAFMRAIRAKYDGIPSVIFDDLALRAMYLPPIRADMTVLETYRCADQPPLAVPVTAFGARYDPHATPDELEQWRQHCGADFSVSIVGEKHFFSRDNPSRVIRAIRLILDGT